MNEPVFILEDILALDAFEAAVGNLIPMENREIQNLFETFGYIWFTCHLAISNAPSKLVCLFCSDTDFEFSDHFECTRKAS